MSKDRALELAVALMSNPWVDPATREVAKRLTEQWHDEDHWLDDPGMPTTAIAPVMVSPELAQKYRDIASAELRPDVTPETDPEHDVVGHEFGGHDYAAPAGTRAVRWFCYSHDAEGYNMYATNGTGHWVNVSERAIGTSFHRIHKRDGRLYCSWFAGPVPRYVP